jgi:hypothetical protein
MKDPVDRVTRELELAGEVSQRLRQVQDLATLADGLVIEVSRVRSHFGTSRPIDADLVEVALSIDRMHASLQTAVAAWLSRGRKA